jgi:hypothetical protein
MGETLGEQEREIVGRTMIFGVFAIGRTHKTADGQIETGRAILPLVVTVGDERRDTMGDLRALVRE